MMTQEQKIRDIIDLIEKSGILNPDELGKLIEASKELDSRGLCGDDGAFIYKQFIVCEPPRR